MCKKLLCLVALLSIVSVASAGESIIIDDFESYFGTPAMVVPIGPWGDTSDGICSSTQTLGGVPFAGAWGALQCDFDGNWLFPWVPGNLETSEYASAGMSLDGSIDFKEGGELHMSLLINESEWANANYMIIELMGTGVPVWDEETQTWDDGTWSQSWIPTHNTFWNDLPQSWAGGLAASIGIDWSEYGITQIEDSVWTEIVITDEDNVPWGNPITDHDSITSISIQFWNGGSDMTKPRVEGTNVFYPKMSGTANIGVDNIYYVPEPMTIGLLGIGGFALIRRKR